jgi:hypothetical protein
VAGASLTAEVIGRRADPHWQVGRTATDADVDADADAE